MDRSKIEEGVRLIIEGIGEDPDREGLVRTPERVADMYEEIFAGIGQDPAEHFCVTFNEGHQEMVLVRDIPLYSVCEHHLCRSWVAHTSPTSPGKEGRICGLSKLARVVDVFAQAPAGPGANDLADRRHDRRAPPAAGRHRRHRGRAPLHVDARREEGRQP